MTEQTTALRSWSTTASNNNSAAPDGMPEGMPPSGVNDWGRKTMAELRKAYEQIQWIDFGHTPTRASDTTFTVPTDLTLVYVEARAVRIFGLTNEYGIIESSSYSAGTGLTTVTVNWRNAGVTPTTPTSVWVGAFSPPPDPEGAGYAVDWLEYPAQHGAGKGTTITVLAEAATVTPDADDSNVFELTLTGTATTLAVPTNAKSGQVINIIIKQDGTGGRTLTFASGYKFPAGTDETLSTGANDIDMISCQNAGGGVWLCSLMKDFV